MKTAPRRLAATAIALAALAVSGAAAFGTLAAAPSRWY